MNRDLCFKAPVFSREIEIGRKVHVIYRNRKGKIKFQGFGIVDSNNVDALIIEKEGTQEGPFNNYLWIKAKDVYYGKHSLKLIESDRFG